MARKFLYILLSFLCLVINSSYGKYVEGEINTLEDWEFITRFCFLSAKGTLRFTFEYPITYGPQHILLYYDTPDQWDAVYKSDKNCTERKAVMNPSNNQIITLDTTSGCKVQTIDGIQKYNCTDERRFIAARERWWYIAVAHCRPLTVSWEQDRKIRTHGYSVYLPLVGNFLLLLLIHTCNLRQ
ncbi:transmembrane protein 145-like [Mercenaria mercenaria]|uniref:transmembrane protein 145-like n=1 Tax=Mercenaria mercenaria TaxID=6596 RepID=UPI00234F5B8A|nr:transmembrane protein 145-like [Mercenaria mercenaria]